MCGPHHLSVAYNGIQLYRSTIVASSFAPSERSYEESLCLGSCTHQKAVVLCRNEGEHFTNFVVGLSTEEDDDDGEIGVLAVFCVSP